MCDHFSRISFILIFTLFTTVVALSGSEDSGFHGLVVDGLQRGIPNASVLLYANGETQQTSTDEAGKFRFPTASAGKYRLEVSADGFLPARRSISTESIKSGITIALDPKPLFQSITVSEHVEGTPSVSMSATKTLTPLRDLPQSVQVVGRQLIEGQAARSMQDVLRNVSGVSLHLGEGRRDQVYIRGFNALRDLYLDGVRDDATYYRDLSNVEQVEVIKGPASVLFGRGSAGGLVNRVTKKPNLERPILEVFGIFGSYGTKRVGADLGINNSSGNLAFRLNGATEDSGSHRHGYYLDRYVVAPALLWKPTYKSQVLAQYEFLQDDRLPDRGVPSLNGRPADVGVGTYYGFPQDDFMINSADSGSLRVEHEFSPTLQLRNVFRYSGYRNTFSNTYPLGVSQFGEERLVRRGQYNVSAVQVNLFNQTEAIASFDFLHMSHTVLVGVEVGRQDSNTIRFTGSADGVALVNPILTRPSYSVTPNRDNFFRGDTLGIYAQDQISILPGLKALVGARHDRFEQDFADRRPAGSDLARIDNAWSPRAGLVYQPTSFTSLYANYSRSFIPSGDGLSLATNQQDLRPETAENFEVGAKNDLLSGRLSANVALFRIDRNNIRTVDPVDPNRLSLVGKQRTEGAEVSLDGNITRRWYVYGGYAWLNARIVRSNDVAAGQPIEGNRPAFIPLNSSNLWSTYAFENGFGFGGGYTFNSNRFAGNDNTVLLPGFTRLDATVFYRTRKYDVSLNVQNLANIRYAETAHGNFTIYPGAPVSGYLSFRYRF